MDRLTKALAQQARREMLSPPIVARKRSDYTIGARVAAMRGQTEVIRITVVRNMRGQLYHSYRYEVVDPQSPDYQAVDDAFAIGREIAMRRSHIYEVRFAEEGSGRWITEVVREIERTEARTDD